MYFKKVIVPSALAVAGLTAMVFQPASNAAPQENDTPSTTSTPADTESTAEVRLVGRVSGSSGEESTAQSVIDSNTTEGKSSSVESSGTEEQAESKNEALDAKESKGIVNKSKASELREGATPKKLDLEKFTIAPEPTPEPAPGVVQTQEASVAVVEPAPSVQAQTASPAPAYNAATGNAVVDAALSQVGTPYVYGGSQPGGFDCSGLTSWAYAQSGKTIPRTSGAQWAGGQAVSVDDMQPGDIVVSYGGGHVGIYIGNGQMVHAPTTGDVVKVSPLQPIDGVVRF